MNGNVNREISVGDTVDIISGHWKGVRGIVVKKSSRPDGVVMLFIQNRYLAQLSSVRKVEKQV